MGIRGEVPTMLCAAATAAAAAAALGMDADAVAEDTMEEGDVEDADEAVEARGDGRSCFEYIFGGAAASNVDD